MGRILKIFNNKWWFLSRDRPVNVPSCYRDRVHDSYHDVT
jgi:hypothetical protein